MNFKALNAYFRYTNQQRKGLFIFFLVVILLQSIYFFYDFTQPEEKLSVETEWLSLQEGIDADKQLKINDSKKVWQAMDYTQESWPEAYMLSMNLSHENQVWAESLTAITYMHFDEVKAWENTHNTVAEKEERGADYEKFKQEKTEVFLKTLERKFPAIRSCIKSIHASTPLSYRDYIGGAKGNLYGYSKDSNNPMNTFFSPKTKVENLFLLRF